MIQILVIGDVMLDHYLLGECSRISPEAPVPVVSIKKDEWRLGGAANVANNLVALKAGCTVVSVYGEDEYAEQIDLLLGESGLITNLIYKSCKRATTVKSRVLVNGHQMIRLDREVSAPLTKDEEQVIIDRVSKKINEVDLVVVSDYNKGLLSRTLLEKIFLIAQTFDVPTIVDPKSVDFSQYKGATFIKPNRKEAELATGIQINDFESLEKASRKIQEITGVEAVITTLSEDGAGVFMNNNLKIIPTKAQKVFDVTGAGDTYLASFVYEYLTSRNVYEACEFANYAAAVVVAKIGSATTTIEEIDAIKNRINCYES